MRVAVGSDPNAIELKSAVIKELEAMGHEVIDLGSDDPIYAKVAIEVANGVANDEFDRGVVMCGTGIGVSITANKVQGAYCALLTDNYQAARAALSNNANMIAMGAQVTGIGVARMMVRTWMDKTSEFDPEGRSGPKVKYIVDYANRHPHNTGLPPTMQSST